MMMEEPADLVPNYKMSILDGYLKRREVRGISEEKRYASQTRILSMNDEDYTVRYNEFCAWFRKVVAKGNSHARGGMVGLNVFLISNGYIAGASRDVRSNEDSFWPEEFKEMGDEFMKYWSIVLVTVPEKIAQKLELQGTSDQVYSDGYEAYEDLQNYIAFDNSGSLVGEVDTIMEEGE